MNDKQSLILIAMELDLPSILNLCNTSKKRALQQII